MKESLVILFTLGNLSLLIYQDFRDREVSLPLLGFQLILSLFYNDLFNQPRIILTNSLINILIILVQILILTILYSIKSGSIFNIFQKHLGIGDVLFLIAIAPLFSPENYILYMILASFLTLVFHQIFIGSKRVAHTIPLAGYLAGILMPILICSKLLNLDLNESSLLNIFFL